MMQFALAFNKLLRFYFLPAAELRRLSAHPEGGDWRRRSDYR